MSKGSALFLFDYSGVMAEPWALEGYDCYSVDIQHPKNDDHKINADLTYGWLPPVKDIKFVAAFPPCDHLAVSGARWFKGKGLRALAKSINMFATCAEICEWSGAPYMIENPVSTISTYWRKPDYTCHPWQFADIVPEDNYTKTTCLWTGGGFVMPEGLAEPISKPDNKKIHHASPGPERANLRSQTPLGMAIAICEANQWMK